MLDLAQVSQQIASMAAAQQLVSEDMRQRLKTAHAHLQLESSRLATFLAKLDRSRTSWLLAEIHEPLDQIMALLRHHRVRSHVKTVTTTGACIRCPLQPSRRPIELRLSIETRAVPR